MAGAGPVVGRAAELGQAWASLRAGRSVLVTGPAGIGKTALARAIADEDERPVHELIASTVGASIPGAALAALLASRSLPAREATPGPSLEPSWMITAALDRLASEPRAAMLLVDDVEHLDELSAAFVHHAITSGHARAVLTSRELEPWLAALVHRGDLDRLVLGPLGRDAVAEMIERELGGPVEGATVARLDAMSEGNPLVLREILAAARDGDRFELRNGVWWWDGTVEWSIALDERLEQRFAGIDDSERAALELLAVGEVVDADALSRITGPKVVESLDERGLLDRRTHVGRELVRAAHPLHATWLRVRVSDRRRGRLLQQLAIAHEEHEDATLRVQRAAWLLDAGADASADALTDAAAEALRCGRVALAERLARAALELDGPVAVRLVLRRCLVAQGRLDEADEVLTPRDAPDVVALRAALSQLDELYFGVPDRADDADGFRSPARVRDRGELLVLEAARLSAASFKGDPVDSVLLGAEMLEPDIRAVPEAEARLGLASIPVLTAAGRPLDALAWVARVEPLLTHPDVDLPFGSLQLGTFAALARLFAGDLAGADSAARQGYEAATASGDQGAVASWAVVRGQVALWRGQPVTAARQLRECLGIMGELDLAGFRGWAAAALAECLAWCADPQALPVLEDSERHANPHAGLLRPMRRLHAAAVAARTGRRAAAIGIGTDVERIAARHAHRLFAVLARAQLARLGVEVSLGGAAGDQQLQGRLLPALECGARAWTTGDADGLIDVGEHLAGLGCAPAAAAALRAAALRFRRQGQPLEAAAATTSATELERSLEVPSLDAVTGSEVRLTSRQRDVALLAASGLTNGEIAKELGIGVRTVHSHLQAAYEKLGVHDRAGLAGILRPVDPNVADVAFMR